MLMVSEGDTCDGCQRNTPWEQSRVVFDSTLFAHTVCLDCLPEVARECPVCEMSLTLDCYADNEMACSFCLHEDDSEEDPEYEPGPFEGETDSDTDEDLGR
jgi:hypothetical protein